MNRCILLNLIARTCKRSQKFRVTLDSQCRMRSLSGAEVPIDSKMKLQASALESDASQRSDFGWFWNLSNVKLTGRGTAS